MAFCFAEGACKGGCQIKQHHIYGLREFSHGLLLCRGCLQGWMSDQAALYLRTARLVLAHLQPSKHTQDCYQARLAVCTQAIVHAILVPL